MAEYIVAGAIAASKYLQQLHESGKFEWVKDAWWLAATLPEYYATFWINEWSGFGMKNDSPTYGSSTPQLTANPGTPVPYCSGLCYLSGKIIRQNDFASEDFSKLIVDFGLGPWDEILATYINDIEWNDLTYQGHEKYYHLGLPNQGPINHYFTEDAGYYRNRVIGEYKLRMKDDLTSINNITILARTRKYLEIGQNIGGTASYTRNPAQILWDTYLTKKRADYTTEMLPYANDWLSLYAYCQTSLCHIDKNYYPVNVPVPSRDLVKATSTYKAYYPKHIVDPDILATGYSKSVSWVSADYVNTHQRINFDFGRKVVLTRLEINNYHSEGTWSEYGIKNFSVQGSNNPADFADTTYDAPGWTYVEIGLRADQHSAVDEACWQTIDLPSSTTGYRYYSIRLVDNWGGYQHMGIKNIRFYTGNAASVCTGDETNVRYAFDFNNDTEMSINDYEKLLWHSFNGKIIRSQGAYKPVWEGAEEADGSGGLQTKTSKHSFTVGTNTVQKTLKWNRIDRKNVYRVGYIDSANKFKMAYDAELKNDADIALRGEETDSEECLFIIDQCLAARRVKLKYNKNQYADYICSFNGFPDSQALEIFDRASLTATVPGWSGKDFNIVGVIEEDYGRAQFVCEAYLSGNYQDQGFEIQPGYPTRTVNLNAPPPAVDSDTVIVTNITAGTGAYGSGALRVQWSPPNWPTYGFSYLWVAVAAAGPYYLAGEDNSGDAYIDGLGTFWNYGDTVYVKLQNVNSISGAMSAFPSTYDGSATIDALTKMAGFYAGQYDIWGGHANIADALTRIVLGGLDGTPKIALGVYADALTINNYDTYTGLYADPSNFRVGGAGQYLKWNGTLSWEGTNTSLTEEGVFTAASAIITGAITATSGVFAGDITCYGNISVTGGYIRAGDADNYTAFRSTGIIAVSSVLGITVDIPSDGSAPTFASGIIKEFIYEIYTSGILRTSEDPATQGGMLINNIRIAGYSSAPLKTFEVIFNGVDAGDFQIGDYYGGNAGIAYDHSSSLMGIDADIRIRNGHGITLIGDDTDPATFQFENGSNSVVMAMGGDVYHYDKLVMAPPVGDSVTLYLGNWEDFYPGFGDPFASIYLRSLYHIELRAIHSTNGSVSLVAGNPEKRIDLTHTYGLRFKYDGILEFEVDLDGNAYTSSHVTALKGVKLNDTLIERVWSFQTDEKEEIYCTPIGPYTVEDSTTTERKAILFCSYNWVWYALDVDDGTEIFSFVNEGRMYGRLQAADVDGDDEIEIFVPCHAGHIRRFNRDGTLDASWELQNVYDREGTGTITSVGTWSIEDSSQNWADNAFLRVNNPTTQDEANLNAEIEFTSGAAIGGKLRISGMENGDTLWTFTETSDNGTGHSPSVGDTYKINPAFPESDKIFMHAGQLIKEGNTWYLYATGQDSHIYKISANNGNIIWKKAGFEAIESWPWIGDLYNNSGRYVLWVCYDQYLRCLNASTGALVWETDLGGQLDGTPQVAPTGTAGKNEIYQACRSGKIFKIDIDTGAILAESGRPQYWQDVACTAVPLKRSDDEWMIYVGGRRGDFGAYECADMYPVWKKNVTPDNINSSARFHDVTGDGNLDVIVADMTGTIHIFHEDGSKIAEVNGKGAIEGIPLIADIDNDGKVEMVVTTTDGWVHCFRFLRGTDEGHWGECGDAILMPIPPDA